MDGCIFHSPPNTDAKVRNKISFNIVNARISCLSEEHPDAGASPQPMHLCNNRGMVFWQTFVLIIYRLK